MKNFIQPGKVGYGAFIGADRPTDILPENFGIWQRINMSADSMLAEFNDG